MGLLDGYLPQNIGATADNPQGSYGLLGNPAVLMGLNVLANSGYTRMPQSAGQAIGAGLLGGLQDYSGLQQAQAANALRAQQIRGAGISNDLSQMTLDAYKGAQGVGPKMSPYGAAVGGPAAMGGQAAPTGGAPAVAGGAGIPTSGGVPAAGGAAPSPSMRTALDIPTLIRQYQFYSSFPGGKEQANQILSLIQKLTPEGANFDLSGNMITQPGAQDTLAKLGFSNQIGKTVAENNKSYDVAPGAAHFQGPTTLNQPPIGAGGGQGSPAYVNPNSPMNVRVDVDKGTGAALAKNVTEIAGGTQAGAMGAIDAINTTSRIRSALDKANLGPGATLRQGVDQLAYNLGIGGQNTEDRLASTRQVIQGLSELALNARASLKGQGAISDYESKLLDRARAGQIDSMTAPELKAVLDVTDRLAQKAYANHQRILGVIKDNPDFKTLAPFYDVPALPTVGGQPAQGGGQPQGGNPPPTKRWIIQDGKLVPAG